MATAAKVLQDSGLRSALDERRADLELRKKAEAAAAAQERERQWRVARGEEVLVAGRRGGRARPGGRSRHRTDGMVAWRRGTGEARGFCKVDGPCLGWPCRLLDTRVVRLAVQAPAGPWVLSARRG